MPRHSSQLRKGTVYNTRRLGIHPKNADQLSNFGFGLVLSVVLMAIAAYIMYVVLADPAATNKAVSLLPVQNVSAAEKCSSPVEVVANLPKLDTKNQYEDPWKNFEYVDVIPNHPEKYGLDNLGLHPVNFCPSDEQVFQALVYTESGYHQFDDKGNLLLSEVGCEGISQICSTCPVRMWHVPTTNVWCGAEVFAQQLELYNGDYTLAVAGYKDVWEYVRDKKGNRVKGSDGSFLIVQENGKPKIDPSYQDYVDRVFRLLTLRKNLG